ncbi:MAG: hypothetical protein WDO14_02305 [Bacteroidota bacterium]
MLRPFQMLLTQFELELANAERSLKDWDKARSVSASSAEIPNNDELAQKIQQLGRATGEVEKFMEQLRVRLQTTDLDFEMLVDGLRPTYGGFALMLKEARALLNYRYTVIQKNEINRRITAVNASGLLSNADMETLQHLWTNVLSMDNDKRLVASKNVFEGRLSDWENLIAQKRNHS